MGDLSYQRRKSRSIAAQGATGLKKGGFSITKARLSPDSFARTAWAADVVKMYLEYTRNETPFKDIKYPPEPEAPGGIYGRRKRGSTRS